MGIRSRMGAKDAAASVVLLLFVVQIARDVRVPLLAYVDLGFHELGHLLTFPLPELLTAVAGSLAQIAVPAGLAVYFMRFQHDRTGSALCLGWAATSAADVARYIADAPYERLELLGGDHDWAFVLSELNAIDGADAYAVVVRILAWAAIVTAFTVLALPYIRAYIARDADSTTGRR